MTEKQVREAISEEIDLAAESGNVSARYCDWSGGAENELLDLIVSALRHAGMDLE